ncbi:hypothetical protein DID78_06990, partial [Candidatus Marinamargulisbacteria bacterium SCGC AG-343-D04]
MQLVDQTSLSYGKIYRIFNGTLAKPLPDDLQEISTCLSLDFRYLLQVSGYLSSETGLQESRDESEVAHYPLLSWNFCSLIFPFTEPITSGLSDDLFSWTGSLQDGFALKIDSDHEFQPIYCSGDVILCGPHESCEDY